MCIFTSLAGIFRHFGGQIRAAMLGKIKVCSWGGLSCLNLFTKRHCSLVIYPNCDPCPPQAFQLLPYSQVLNTDQSPNENQSPFWTQVSDHKVLPVSLGVLVKIIIHVSVCKLHLNGVGEIINPLKLIIWFMTRRLSFGNLFFFFKFMYTVRTYFFFFFFKQVLLLHG